MDEREMNEMFNMRLLKFARYLLGIEEPLKEEDWECEEILVYATEDNVRIQYSLRCAIWIFKKLPFAFEGEWIFEDGEPVLDYFDREAGIANALIEWFGLNESEFSYFFEGKGVLGRSSTPFELASNILNII